MKSSYSNYSIDNKMVIKCVHCYSKLRVPLDKGKISIACPVCRNEFIYKPDSILTTLKQIWISTKSWMAKSRKNKIIFIITVLLILASLFFAFFRPFNRNNEYRQRPIEDGQPGLIVEGTVEKNRGIGYIGDSSQLEYSLMA